MVKYKPPVVDFKKPTGKTQVVPDQSLSIREIVKRFVKGIPVDVAQRQPVFNDQTEADLEKLARMDFAEKVEYANNMADKAAGIKAEFQDAQRSYALAKANEARATSEAAESANVKKRQPSDKQDGVN